MKKCCEYIKSAVKDMEDSVKRNEELVQKNKFCVEHGLPIDTYQEDIDWLNECKKKLETLKKIQEMIFWCHDEGMSFCENCGELKPNSELVQDGICDECWENQPDDNFGGAPSKSSQQGLYGSLI